MGRFVVVEEPEGKLCAEVSFTATYVENKTRFPKCETKPNLFFCKEVQIYIPWNIIIIYGNIYDLLNKMIKEEYKDLWGLLQLVRRLKNVLKRYERLNLSKLKKNYRI